MRYTISESTKTTKIETAAEARAMFLANDADAIEEAACEWLTYFERPEDCAGTYQHRVGVDGMGDIWLTEGERLSDERLVCFANWARENLN